MKRTAFILASLLMLCTESLRAEVFTIDFNKGTMSGKSSSFAGLPSHDAEAFCAFGWENIAEYSESSCFYRNNGCGIRIGRLNGTGTANIVFTFSEQIQSKGIVKIVVYASRGTDSADSELSIYAGTNTMTRSFAFADMKGYNANEPESESYVLPDIVVDRKFKMLKVAARNNSFVMLHRIDIFTPDEATTALPVHYGGTYYAAFSSDKATFFPENVSPCKVTVRDGELVLTAMETEECFGQSGCKVPANTGVLLASANGSVTYSVLDGETLNALSNNMLRPSSRPMTGNSSFYRFAYSDAENETGLGFYWGAEDGGAFACEEGSAYLAVKEGKAEGYPFDNVTYEDAIRSTWKSADEMGVFYNLAGQRVSKPSPGKIYIHGGRKYIAE